MKFHGFCCYMKKYYRVCGPRDLNLLQSGVRAKERPDGTVKRRTIVNGRPLTVFTK